MTGRDETEQYVIKELKRLNDCIENIKRRMSCDAHKEILKELQRKINWLVIAFLATIVGGIVLGIWIKLLLR